MKLTLEAIELLDAIEIAGSYAAAAQRLNRVPSAVTHAVRKLEADLGVTLYRREGRRAVLTEAGRLLLAEGRQLLRAAGETEQRIHQLATGWERELRIAVDGLFDLSLLFPLVAEFDGVRQGTSLRFLAEAVGGGWDALVAGRADLVIGASGEPPPGRWATQPLGALDLVFAVAPDHPLAALPEPLAAAEIARHRAAVLADSSRELQGRMWGLIEGQNALTVPDPASKRAVQEAGLGVGQLPRVTVDAAVAAGRLVEKRVAELLPPVPFYLAWRSAADKPQGRALAWFTARLSQPAWIARLQAAAGLQP